MLADSPGEKLFQLIYRDPGNYSQMCGAPTVPRDIPLPAFDGMVTRYYSIGLENARRLQAQRHEIIPVLCEHLREVEIPLIHYASAYQNLSFKQLGEISLQDPPLEPGELDSILLEMLRITHAIECLPEILKIENQLHTLLVAAEKNGYDTLPRLKLNSAAQFFGSFSAAERKKAKETFTPIEAIKQIDLFAAKIYQRELLAVIARLLREEEFQPVFKSTLQTKYVEGLYQAARSGDLKDIKKAADIGPENKGWIIFDEEMQIPRYLYSPVFVTYSEELRSEVRNLAESFLTSVPTYKWKKGSAMQPVSH